MRPVLMRLFWTAAIAVMWSGSLICSATAAPFHVATAVKDSLSHLQPFDSVGAGEGKVERVASTRRVMGKDGKINPRWSHVRDLALRDEPEGLIDPMPKNGDAGTGRQAVGATALLRLPSAKHAHAGRDV